MQNFQKLAEGMDVLPLAHELIRHPELWDAHKFRTSYANTPHVDVADIWLRYSAPQDNRSEGQVLEDTTPIWYEGATTLRHWRPLVGALMLRVGAYALERLLITRVPPGGRILPHADNAGAYVNQGDIQRYHVVLQGLPGSLFKCGEDTVQMLTGEVWWFNPHEVHEVLNNSVDDRVHLLVDLRLW